MKIHTLPALLGLVISLFLSASAATADGSENLRQNVLRLHIPANSDSAADQNVKMKVRDRILSMSDEIFSNCKTREDILSAAEENLPEIEKAADEILIENGFSYRSHAEITDMYFDDRTYESVFVPHGNYTALRITLGSGRGQNWWCVMYPALCLPCFSDDENSEETISESNISDEGEDILNSSEEEIHVKLYIAELLEKLFGEND